MIILLIQDLFLNKFRAEIYSYFIIILNIVLSTRMILFYIIILFLSYDLISIL